MQGHAAAVALQGLHKSGFFEFHIRITIHAFEMQGKRKYKQIKDHELR